MDERMDVSLPPEGQLVSHESESTLKELEKAEEQLMIDLVAHLNSLTDDEARREFLEKLHQETVRGDL